MPNKTKNRLITLRILGIIFTIAAIYIVASTIQKDKPTNFWAKFRLTPDFNLYSLPGEWVDSENQKVTLKKFSNKVSVFSFVYLNCKSYCPRIVADMIRLRNKMKENNQQINYIFFLFDDVTGNPRVINKFYQKYNLNKKDWQVLTTKKQILKNLSDKFKLRYSEIKKPEPEYMHSNLIAATKKDGTILLADFGLTQKHEDIIKTVLSSTK